MKKLMLTRNPTMTIKRRPMKTYTCKKCKTVSETIFVRSYCTQKVHIVNDVWTDTSVEDTVAGFCEGCGAEISATDLKKLLGYSPTPDYMALLTEVADDAETEGCDGMATIRLATLKKIRKVLGYRA